MLHLPQFEPIWVVMHMGRPSVQVRHAIKTAVSWLIRAALGQLWCLFGSFGWCVKITRPTRSTRVWPELLCRWFCCSHYSCYYISIVFLYNQRTQWHVKVHFVHLCLQRSTHTALNLFSLFAFVSAAANGFKVESSLQEINIWFTSVGWYGGNVRTPYLHMGRFHLICYFDVSINSLSQEKDYSTGIIFVAKLQNQAAKFLVLYSLYLYSLNLQYNMI